MQNLNAARVLPVPYVVKLLIAFVSAADVLQAMSHDHHVELAKPDKEQLVRKYGTEVASKLLSVDADIRRLYKRAIDSVGQDVAQIAQLAKPLCQVIAEAERQRRRCRWQRLMLCLAMAVVLLSSLIACETSCRFINAVTRILWIKVYQSCVSLNMWFVRFNKHYCLYEKYLEIWEFDED